MGITLEAKPPVLPMTPEIGNQVEIPELTDKLSFSEGAFTSCVGIIDIVNSTKITSRLNRHQMNKFYSIFINWTTAVVRGYGGKVAKNMGDGLLFYFPLSEDQSNAKAIRDCLSCGIAMSTLHPNINSKFNSESLPELNYRISLDYGEVSSATSADTPTADIFSVTVNICAKINYIADPNTVVIGGDMYQVSRNFSGYSFQQAKKSISVAERPYPVYTVTESEAVVQYLRSIRYWGSQAFKNNTDGVDGA